MNAASLSRRWYSWVYRWWQTRVAPRRRPVVRPRTLTLEVLEHRASPTSFALASPVDLAPTPSDYRD